MYLARKVVGNSIRYFIRESYRDGKYLRSRELFDLGTDPSDYIVYPGGNAYYIDEVVEERLRSFGQEPDADELEDIFWCFVDPEIRYAVGAFRQRGKKKQTRAFSREDEERLQREIHLFDKRRMHYLRSGEIDQSRIGRASPRLFAVLCDKSRDEIEQHFLNMETDLDPYEHKRYVYVICDLQRFFTQLSAKIMPEALDQDDVDRHFLAEICRLNSDPSFWQGMNKGGGLHEYMIRYVIMYFDTEFQRSSFLDDYLRNFIDAKRFYTAPAKKSSVNLDEAGTLFGVTRASIEKMTKRGLTRLYRRMAQKLHPDKGGDHDKFIKLTETYRDLLNRTK
jgi:hypothetical protein